MPTCPLVRKNDDFITASRTFGETLVGTELELDGTKLEYQKDQPDPVHQCQMKIANWQLKRLYLAAYDNYITRLMVDDMTVAVATLSVIDEPHAIKLVPVLYTQRNWVIYYNKKNEITDVYVSAADPVTLPDYHSLNGTETFDYNMSYTVRWILSDNKDEREDLYKDAQFFHSSAHIFSVFNAVFFALFFVGFVVLIYRYISQGDSSQSANQPSWKRRSRSPAKFKQVKEHADDDIDTIHTDEQSADKSVIIEQGGESEDRFADMDLGDCSGWKQINNDVFRAPRSPSLFSALIGTGWQLLAVIATLLLLPNLGFGSYFDQGSIVSSFVWMYLVYSLFGGFKSSQILSSFSGKHWIRTLSLQGFSFPMIALCCYTIMCMVHAYNGSAVAPGFGIYFLITVLFVFIVLPLTFVGTLIQRRNAEKPDDQADSVNVFPGIIPPKPWYLSNVFLVLVTGIPAFGVISTELYYIASAYSTYWWYYTYGFTFTIFISMICIIACSSILVTFMLLNTEDYRWQWSSFLGGCSVGLYSFIFFRIFYLSSQMYGSVQFFAYHTFVFLLSVVISFICGTVSYASSSIFVHIIYRLGKMD